MAEFVLDNHVNGDAPNLVHLDHCAAVKSLAGTLYIGSYGTPVAALNIAKGLKYAVDYCPSCLGKMCA